MYKYLEHFFQDYSDEPELGIPSHWCVKYLEDGKGFVDYSYHSSLSEAIEWARKNTDYLINIEGEDINPNYMFEDTGVDLTAIFETVSNPQAPHTEPVKYGNTPPVLPEECFTPKEFSTLKDSRTNNLYKYFPIWFEELCHVEGVYLAGGALRNLLGGDDIIADIDLFFKNEKALKSAERIMKGYEGSDDGCWYEAFRCPAGELITYKTTIDKPDEDKTDDDYRSQRKVQFITKSFYKSPVELINSFDFIPTCACLYDNVLYTHPDWASHVKRKTLGLHFVSYPVATLSRMLKYSHKGYKVLPETLLKLVIDINEGDFDDSRLALYVD